MLRMPLPLVLWQNVNREMSQRSKGCNCVCIAYIAVHLKSLKHLFQLFLALYVFIRSYMHDNISHASHNKKYPEKGKCEF